MYQHFLKIIFNQKYRIGLFSGEINMFTQENLKQTLLRYETCLTDDVIPFWQNHCEDKQYGGYFTSLDRDGSVYDTIKYMWMQWRIVYMFSEFYLSKYSKPEFLGIAERGFDFLYNHGRDQNGQKTDGGLGKAAQSRNAQVQNQDQHGHNEQDGSKHTFFSSDDIFVSVQSKNCNDSILW